MSVRFGTPSHPTTAPMMPAPSQALIESVIQAVLTSLRLPASHGQADLSTAAQIAQWQWLQNAQTPVNFSHGDLDGTLWYPTVDTTILSSHR